jgi:pentatricopeptide repeat protein
MLMHERPIDIDKESFSIALKLCAATGQAERAFFYMDEMRSLGLEPDDRVFLALFRACAEAPHWVNGYQVSLFFIFLFYIYFIFNVFN